MDAVTMRLVAKSLNPRIEVIRQRLELPLPRKRFNPARVVSDGPYVIDEAVPRARALRVAISGHVARDGSEWLHASLSYRNRMPGYEDLVRVHAAVWPDGHAYQVFVPPEEHYTYDEFCLHLWGHADGSRALPDLRSEDGAV